MSILDTAKNAAAEAKQVAGELSAEIKSEQPVDPLIRKHGALGREMSRVDGPVKVRGAARFAAEVPAEGLLYATPVHSRIARGRITVLDTTIAEAAPGVGLVMTHRNAPPMEPPAVYNSNPRAAGASSLPIMQDDQVHWNGEAVALVLAETQEQADHAASLVRVEYEEQPASLRFEAAASVAHYPKDVLGEPPTISIGDAEAALKASAHSVDLIYHTPRHSHAAIEPHAATIWWDGDELVIHDATQMLSQTRWTMAAVLGVDEDKVRVLSPFVGGGFGGKGLWSHQFLGAAAARLAGRPVRIALSREATFRLAGGRTTTRQRVALGAKKDGTLAALIHTGVVAMTAHNDCPEQFTFPARHLYAADSFRIEQQVAEIDMLANTFMRAPGESIGTFALEAAVDELAEKMGLDPIEFRARIEPSTDPTSGKAFSSRNMTRAFRDGAERFGWSARNPTPGARRDGEWLIGMGVATAVYPYYRMPGGSARITLTHDGKARVGSASHEMGMGTATTQAMAAADRLGLPVEDVVFEHGDTALPYATVAGGSSQTASISAAVRAAAEALTAELVKLVGNDSAIAGLGADELEARDAGLASVNDPQRFESYRSILARAGRDGVTVEAAAPPPVEMQEYTMYSFGAQFAEVRVSAITGETRVTRFLGSFDTGRILNPKTARSQFRGGIIMGLGLALMEQTDFDERSGRVMNPSLAEYHVPVHLDVPEIDVIWTDIPDPHAPLGAHGIGEIGITGVGAAVANAVYNATGKRVRDLPITLDKLL